MDGNTEKSVQLAGGLESTATWIKISANGELVVDYYDFSNDAQDFFGNDVAYLLTIKAHEKKKILQLLSGDAGTRPAEASEYDVILHLMQKRFNSYFEVKDWLKANHIEYQKSFDSWA